MSKPTRGATKVAPAKRKAKRRPELRPTSEATATATVVSDEAVQAEEEGAPVTQTPVLQFRPRPRETAPMRAPAAKAAAARTGLPTIDYSYVYTDLRIIGVLVASLLVVLIVLSFVVR